VWPEARGQGVEERPSERTGSTSQSGEHPSSFVTATDSSQTVLNHHLVRKGDAVLFFQDSEERRYFRYSTSPSASLKFCRRAAF
jgi:hypothetical protein